MNSWKLNSIIGHHAREAICKGLKMERESLYRAVKNIDNNGIITVYNNKKYRLIIEEIKE